MMTESEALKRWCPFARVAMYVRGDAGDLERPVDLVGHGCNRMLCDDPEIHARIQAAIDAPGGTKCMGSKCMAWQWSGEVRVKDGDGLPLGFCGLAGNPERPR